MDLDAFIAAAWSDHADDAAGVAARLDAGLARVTDERGLVRLAELGHHVHGEHLGDWAGGIAFQQRLAGLPAFAADGISGQAVRRCRAALGVSAGGELAAGDGGMDASDTVRIAAMAAANQAERDCARADALLREAVRLAATAHLSPGDPAHRALAITGNNLACTLEEKRGRSPAERDLMLLAAQTARTHWAIAGGWLETERAEYRLAMSWLQAGDFARAAAHARACVDIVDAHGGPAFERFFGREAVATVARAAGDAAGHRAAVEAAQAAFDALDAADRDDCRPALEQIAAP